MITKVGTITITPDGGILPTNFKFTLGTNFITSYEDALKWGRSQINKKLDELKKEKEELKNVKSINRKTLKR